MFKFKNYSKEETLEAVKQEGDALRYVEKYYKEIEVLDSYYKEEYIKATKKNYEEELKERIEELERKVE